MMETAKEKKAALLRFAECLEESAAQFGELVLTEVAWDLERPNLAFSPGDPYAGMTSRFRGLVEQFCSSREAWLSLYVALLLELSNPRSDVRARFLELSGRLWMKTVYGDLTVWHTAFPPLDGGGSSQARAFHCFFRRRFSGRRFRTLFEWCSGPGFLGFTLLHFGWCDELVLGDINPHIAPGIERTVRENGLEGRVRYYVSDNLKEVPPEERFDLVVGNPPWAFREIEGLPNPLIPNDPGWRIHQEFLAQVKPYLRADAVLCLSAYEPFKAVAYIEEQQEPWDVRPRPPIEDFRRFITAGGLALRGVYKPPVDDEIAFGRGMSFLLIGLPEHKYEPPQLDLLGLGGAREGRVTSYHFDLSLVRQVDLEQLVHHQTQLEAIRLAVYQMLSRQHLTQVLSALFPRREEAGEKVLESLGIPAAVAEAFPEWGDPSRFDYRPPVPGLRLEPESCRHPVQALRLQLGQDAPICVGLRMLRELMRALGDELDLLVTVKPGFDEPSVRRLLAELEGYREEGVEFFPHGHQTLFAQDNGRLARVEGRPVLLVPAELPPHRQADTLSTAPIPLVRSRFRWEGGNLLCDGNRVLFGANSVAANMRHLGLTFEQVVQGLSEETGYRVVVLGDAGAALSGSIRGEGGLAVPHAVDGGQADFHIDFDCSLLGPSTNHGAPRVMLADPELGFNHLDELLRKDELFSGHLLGPARTRETFKRALERSALRRVPLLAGYEATLRAAGYEVIRLPDLRLVADENYLARVNWSFTYCNALVLRRGEQPAACLLRCGLPGMEAEVQRIYERQGVSVVWIGDEGTSSELLGMRGGLHCFCSIFATT